MKSPHLPPTITSRQSSTAGLGPSAGEAGGKGRAVENRDHNQQIEPWYLTPPPSPPLSDDDDRTGRGGEADPSTTGRSPADRAGAASPLAATPDARGGRGDTPDPVTPPPFESTPSGSRTRRQSRAPSLPTPCPLSAAPSRRSKAITRVRPGPGQGGSHLGRRLGAAGVACDVFFFFFFSFYMYFPPSGIRKQLFILSTLFLCSSSC
jgi:hypothetical protein